MNHGSVHVSAKTDYAIRALTEMAAAGAGESLPAHTIADRQQVPVRFLLNILAELRRVGLVDSRRGPSGGWGLARPADQVTMADIVRAVEGPLTDSDDPVARQTPPTEAAAAVADLWGCIRAGIRDLLEQTTLAELAARSSGAQNGDREADRVEHEVREDRAC